MLLFLFFEILDASGADIQFFTVYFSALQINMLAFNGLNVGMGTGCVLLRASPAYIA